MTYPQGSNIHGVPHDATIFFSVVSFDFLIFFGYFPQFNGFVYVKNMIITLNIIYLIKNMITISRK